MAKVIDIFKDVLKEGGAAIVENVKTTAQAETLKTALAVVFGAPPEYTTTPAGKYVFYWTGEKKQIAQKRVWEMTKGNPNSKFVVQYGSIAAPAVLRIAAPYISAGVLLYAILKR